MKGDESPQRPLSRAEAASRTRERLIAAAMTVVARRGVAGASVDEIAAAAGRTAGALYSQFGSKDALVMEAMHIHVAGRVARARAIVESGSFDDQDIRLALGRLLAGAADGDPETALLFWTELWLHAARNPQLADLLGSDARAVDEVIAQSIRDRRAAPSAAAAVADEGEVSDEALATVVSSLFRGLALRRRIDPAAVPDELLGQAMRLLVAGRRALRSTRPEGERP